MKTKYQDFEVLVPNIEGTAIAERVKVKIPIRWDDDLESWVLTPESHEIIDNTKARHMGLLLPDEFKALRKRFNLTQKEMGVIFQAGEKSWTRWESGQHRPSRSISLLIRAVYEDELSINYLLKCAGKQESQNDDKGAEPVGIPWLEQLKTPQPPEPYLAWSSRRDNGQTVFKGTASKQKQHRPIVAFNVSTPNPLFADAS